MTRIDFYVLPAVSSAMAQTALPIDVDSPALDDDEKNRFELVCKLALKAARQQQSVYVHTPDPETTELLDALLSQRLQHSEIGHRLAVPDSRPAAQHTEAATPMRRPKAARAESAYTLSAPAHANQVQDCDPSSGRASVNDVPIEIGHNSEPAGGQQVLINLAANVPLFFSRFRRMLEIISADTEHRLSGRQRYLFYRDRGYPLKHHHLR